MSGFELTEGNTKNLLEANLPKFQGKPWNATDIPTSNTCKP